MKVNEIFVSIEGEGIRTGLPVTFIRLHGCNLNCSYCDTRYSCEGDDYTEMSYMDIVDKALMESPRRVTITGGEPLIHANVEHLIDALLLKGFEVNIETNGSVNIEKFLNRPNLIITMDWKSPSSGMRADMVASNLKNLRPQDVLKFVVGSLDDLKDVRWTLEDYTPACHVFISPVFSKIEAVDIVNFVLNSDMNDCRVQVQLHKIVWDPNKRGV